MKRRLKAGMVGGGRDAFIGGVHRMAMRLDDLFDLKAGALSSEAEKARASGADLGLAPDRPAGIPKAISKASPISTAMRRN